MPKLDIGEEVGAKKAFVWAIDWPGWCRSGKDRDLAIDALIAARGRYAKVARRAGLELPHVQATDLRVVETTHGGGGTDFGVPSNITTSDRRRTTAADAERLAGLVEAAWVIFDRVAERSPAELRKGPRGGGRDRDKMIGHVIEADHAYAREIGIRLPEPSLADRPARRGRAGRCPRGAPPSVRWLANRRSQVAGSLRGPADSLACPRPCLGDGGPHGAVTAAP